MQDPVTIMTFTHPNDASVIRTFLESEDILTFVSNETMVQVNPLFSNAVGGVQLQVERADAEKAIHLLKEKGFDLGKKSSENKIVAWINKLMGK